MHELTVAITTFTRSTEKADKTPAWKVAVLIKPHTELVRYWQWVVGKLVAA